MENKKILWLTADCFIDVDRQLVPYLRSTYQLNIQWFIVQSLAGSTVPKSDDYEVLQIHHRGKDPRSYFELREYFKLLHIEQYDLVYSDSIGFYYYPALMRFVRETPLIHAAHNVNPYPVWPWDLRLEVKYIFHKGHHFQMFSQHTARWFKEHYPSKSFFYAPMVVKDFGEVKTDHYQFDESKVNLLFFGNIVGNKRLDLLIDAVKSLPSEIQDKLHLNICGKCRMDEQSFIHQIGDCKAISAYFKRIPDEEIPELFTKSQYLMLPYEDVAQSGPHMIAYNYNLPVIASDISGFAERVEDGKNGYLFHVNDKQALMETITKAVTMCSDDYQNMKAELKEFVDKNYSLQAVSQRYIDYFDSIL